MNNISKFYDSAHDFKEAQDFKRKQNTSLLRETFLLNLQVSHLNSSKDDLKL